MTVGCAWRALLGLVAVGCASHRPALESVPTGEDVFFTGGRVYRMRYHDAFEALRKRLDELGYNLSRADRNSGVIATFPRPLREAEHRHCDCTRVRGFRELGRKVKMTFVVSEVDPEVTRVTVRSRFTIYWSDGFRTFERSCISRGKLERQILALE